MSYGGSLNNGGIMSKTRAGIARTRRGPTSDPKKPKYGKGLTRTEKAELLKKHKPGSLLKKHRPGSRARTNKTSDPKIPKPKKESFLMYNSKTKKFRTGSNPGKNEKRAKIDLRAGTIDFGD